MASKYLIKKDRQTLVFKNKLNNINKFQNNVSKLSIVSKQSPVTLDETKKVTFENSYSTVDLDQCKSSFCFKKTGK